jgi:hypothetical protein
MPLTTMALAYVVINRSYSRVASEDLRMGAFMSFLVY